jgi:hypothetical protein
MLINIQRYFFGFLFLVMLLVCVFHGVIDARRTHHQHVRTKNLGQQYHGYADTFGRTSKQRYSY